MTFHILMNHVATLFLGINLLTTLTFESEIKSFYYGGSKEDVFLKETDGNTLLLKAYTSQGLSNLLVVTGKRKYYFQLGHDPQRPHTFVEVRHGLINHAFTMKLQRDDYELLEGQSSILIVNKKDVPLHVNGSSVKSREHFSKGIPIFINGERVLN
jgi:hypothetical protein